MAKRFDQRDTRLIMIAAAVVAAALFYALRARGPVRTSTLSDTGVALICEQISAKRHRAWQRIIVHHSATTGGSATAIDRFHRNKGWRSLGYHFVIGNGRGSGDGEIEVGPRWRRQQDGAHVRTGGLNRVSIGICLVGDFRTQVPTRAQMASLVRLVRYLQQRFRIPASRVQLHRDVAATQCPGPRFPEKKFRAQL